MATEEQDVDVKSRRGRGRKQRSRPMTDSKPGIFKVLWADLRRREVPGEPDPEEMEWLEQQRELRRQESAKVGRVSSMSDQQLEQLRKRYWQSSN